MNSQPAPTKPIRTHYLIPVLLLSLPACALAGTQLGSLSPDDATWDRPTATGLVDNGPCMLTLNDSVNDAVSYDLYYIRATNDTTVMDIAVTSLEPTPLDLDPMIVVYCNDFDANLPLSNVDQIDDDSAGYPNALVIGTNHLDTNNVYAVVVSSYSNYPQSQFGDYEITLGPGLYFSTACRPDFNGDGMLNFLDISAFLALFGNADIAADYNNDGVFNFSDVSELLADIGAGCP